MNRTLHSKLSDKSLYTVPATHLNNGDIFAPGFQLDKKVKEELLKDTLSPRPEAISRLLELSRSL